MKRRLLRVGLAVFSAGMMASGWTALGQAGASPAAAGQYLGFDSNEYPGDAALPTLRKQFAFVGYWLTNPPGEQTNHWHGKRAVLLKQGFGFLVLANGRLDKEIVLQWGRFQRHDARGKTPRGLGQGDADEAVAAARREKFPAGTVIYLDQEEGGRLEREQKEYLIGWIGRLAKAEYKPGVYLSGQPVGDGPGKTITTVQHLRTVLEEEHLPTVAMWVYQDACPPSNGCTLHPPALSASGTTDVTVWQYAQSPRRREITAACAKTYAADGNCYLSELPKVSLDLNVAGTGDPSHGR